MWDYLKARYLAWVVGDGGGQAPVSLMSQQLDSIKTNAGVRIKRVLTERWAAVLHLFWRRKTFHDVDGKAEANWKQHENSQICSSTGSALHATEQETKWEDYVNRNDMIFALLPKETREQKCNLLAEKFKDFEPESFFDRVRHRWNSFFADQKADICKRAVFCDSRKTAHVTPMSVHAGAENETFYVGDKKELNTENIGNVLALNVLRTILVQSNFICGVISRLHEDDEHTQLSSEFFRQEHVSRFVHRDYTLPCRRGDIVEFYDPDSNYTIPLRGKILSKKRKFSAGERYGSSDSSTTYDIQGLAQDSNMKDCTWHIPEGNIILSKIDTALFSEICRVRYKGHYRDDGRSCITGCDEVFPSSKNKWKSFENNETVVGNLTRFQTGPVSRRKVRAEAKKKAIKKTAQNRKLRRAARKRNALAFKPYIRVR